MAFPYLWIKRIREAEEDNKGGSGIKRKGLLLFFCQSHSDHTCHIKNTSAVYQ